MGTPRADASLTAHVQLVGLRVTRERKRHEWKSADLARIAHVNPAVVSRVEAGAKPYVAAHVVALLARALGVTMDALWHGQEAPPPPEAPTVADIAAARAFVARRRAGLSSSSAGSTQRRSGKGTRGGRPSR